jgi:hypothetical protein
MEIEEANDFSAGFSIIKKFVYVIDVTYTAQI